MVTRTEVLQARKSKDSHANRGINDLLDYIDTVLGTTDAAARTAVLKAWSQYDANSPNDLGQLYSYASGLGAVMPGTLGAYKRSFQHRDTMGRAYLNNVMDYFDLTTILPSFANVVHWWDGSDIAQLFQTEDTSSAVDTDGQNVGHVADKGALPQALINADIGERPTWDATLGGLNFDGAGKTLFETITTGLGADFSVACIFRPDAGISINNHLFLYDTQGECSMRAAIAGAPNRIEVQTSGSGLPVGEWTDDVNSAVVRRVHNSGADHATRWNWEAAEAVATLQTPDAPDDAGVFFLGASSVSGANDWVGRIYEMVIWNTDIGVAGMDAFELYATSRKAVAWA